MAELYLFNDNGVYHAFSPTLFSKDFGGITYAPTIVTRSELNLTDNFAKSPIVFKFERTHTYIKSLLAGLPEIPITVTIYRNSLVYWRGRVLEIKANPLSIEVSCDSVFSTSARSGLQPRVTMNCRHVLYSANCGVIQSSWDSPYAVSGVNSTVFTVTGLSQPTGYFNGGVAKLNGQDRFIKTQVGTTITLVKPFTGVQSGTIHLFPGCNLTEAACTAFNNLVNFGGFSRMPKKNPTGPTGLL